MAAKRYPLPKRFNAALSEKAYEKLRSLNDKYHYGNNYLLTILLENLDRIVVSEEMERVFAEFKDEFGAPVQGKMERKPARDKKKTK
jgi:hypothetical protein